MGALESLIPFRLPSCIVPSIPIVIYVMEGHIEPNAKWFTGYDLFERWMGIGLLCAAIGGFVDLALDGAMLLIDTLAELILPSLRAACEIAYHSQASSHGETCEMEAA